MTVLIRRLWSVFIRLLIGLLLIILALALFFSFNPDTLQAALQSLPLPGVVDIPTPGPTPPSPIINAPRGALPGGYRAFQGAYSGGVFGCGFLLELAQGQLVGVSAAHTAPVLPVKMPAEFQLPDRSRAAALKGPIRRGRTFMRDDFTLDYTLWAVMDPVDAQYILQPDPRGLGMPGEAVMVFSLGETGTAGSKTWPGVVIDASEHSTWIQLADSFDPRGMSGCPVVSQHTGKVIGMIVAGKTKSPVIMGLNPVGALVANAKAALSAQR